MILSLSRVSLRFLSCLVICAHNTRARIAFIRVFLPRRQYFVLDRRRDASGLMFRTQRYLLC